MNPFDAIQRKLSNTKEKQMDRLKVYGLAILLAMAFAYTLTQGAATKAEYKVTRMSTTEVGISCNNGADPTGIKVGNTVVMSCTEEHNLPVNDSGTWSCKDSWSKAEFDSEHCKGVK